MSPPRRHVAVDLHGHFPSDHSYPTTRPLQVNGLAPLAIRLLNGKPGSRPTVIQRWPGVTLRTWVALRPRLPQLIMDWIPLLGAVGIGAIATKILDVLWLQRVMQSAERTKWLREQRIKAYGALAREFATSDLGRDPRIRTGIHECLLVTEDSVLQGQLMNYFPSKDADFAVIVSDATRALTDDQRNAKSDEFYAKIKARELEIIDRMRIVVVGK